MYLNRKFADMKSWFLMCSFLFLTYIPSYGQYPYTIKAKTSTLNGVKVYFNVEDDALRWKKHISSNKLTWINVSERLKPGKSKLTKAFGVGAYPTSLLIDKTGKIIYNSDETDPEMGELEAKIKTL